MLRTLYCFLLRFFLFSSKFLEETLWWIQACLVVNILYLLSTNLQIERKSLYSELVSNQDLTERWSSEFLWLTRAVRYYCARLSAIRHHWNALGVKYFVYFPADGNNDNHDV